MLKGRVYSSGKNKGKRWSGRGVQRKRERERGRWGKKKSRTGECGGVIK